MKILFTFDLDGVLHINPFGRKVFPDICRILAPSCEDSVQRGDPLGPDPERMVLKMIQEESARRLACGQTVEAYDWGSVVNTVAERLQSNHRFNVAKLVQDCCHPPHIGLHPYATELLRYLTAHGVTLVAVTNGYDIYQFPVMKAMGIAQFFTARITPDQVHAVKPMPAMFQAAMAAGGQCDLCVHVGDSPIQDIFGASRVGMKTVWVHPPLPSSLGRVPAWERPKSSSFQTTFRTMLGNETALAEPNPADVVPDYAVIDLQEIIAVFHHLTQ